MNELAKMGGAPKPFAASDLPKNVEEWEEFHKELLKLSRSEYLHSAWLLARTSLYFLLRFVLSPSEWRDDDGRPMVARPFVLDLATAVQSDYNGVLDIAARGHLKSSIKTLALPIQTLLVSPETTIGIFSYSRALARKFLALVKTELEQNELLKALSWDFARGQQLFWSDPAKEAPTWSQLEGLVINRSGNSKEASVEAWGLIESMPVGRHFRLRLYDDIVVPETVNTPELIQKAVSALSMSQALGMPGGQVTYTGTFYAHSDPHCELLRQGVRLRLNPCYEILSLVRDEVDGQITHLELDPEKPVLFTKKELEDYTKGFLPKEVGTQMYCDPRAGEVTGFEEDWIEYYDRDPEEESRGKNIYITVDAANSKKKGSSYTSIWVIGVGRDGNYYVLDGVRDRLNLDERTGTLFALHRKWRPYEVRYERYGMMVDIPHIKSMQNREGYRFRIREVGGTTAKDDRIERLVPLFSAGRFYLPRQMRKRRQDGTKYDLVHEFKGEELLRWPSCTYKDMLDSLARIAEPDMPVVFPKTAHTGGEERYNRKETPQLGSWMVA